MRRWLAVVGFAGLLPIAAGAGCGEDLVPGEQTEAPIFSTRGSLVTPDAPALHVAALWVDPFGAADDVMLPASYARDVTESSGAFQLDFFRPPPAALIHEEPEFAFAMAEIVAFEDRDPKPDGRFSVAPRTAGSTILPPDVYRGSVGDGQHGRAIFYIARSRQGNANVIPELDGMLLQPPGYYVGVIECPSAGQGWARPDDLIPSMLTLLLGPPTDVFPEARTCLHTHVAPAAAP